MRSKRTPTATTASIHFRHRGSASIAWLDGHVTAEPMAFTGPSVYGFTAAQQEAAGLGWFGPAANDLFDRE